jgi:hypothetical protein
MFTYDAIPLNPQLLVVVLAFAIVLAAVNRIRRRRETTTLRKELAQLVARVDALELASELRPAQRVNSAPLAPDLRRAPNPTARFRYPRLQQQLRGPK